MGKPHLYKDAIKEIDATSGAARKVLERARDALKFLETEGRLAPNAHVDWLATSSLIAGTQGRILGEDQYATVALLKLPYRPGLHHHGYIVKTYNITDELAAETAVSNLTMTLDSKLQGRLPTTVGYYTPTDDTIAVFTERKPYTGDALLTSLRKALKEKGFTDQEGNPDIHPQDILSMVFLLKSYVNATKDVWNAGYKYADLKWENLGFEVLKGRGMSNYHSTIIDVGHLEPHDGWRERIIAAGLPLNTVRAFNPFYSPERMVRAAREREEIDSMTEEMLAYFGEDKIAERIIETEEQFDLRDSDPTIMAALAIGDATDGIYDSIRANPEAYKNDVLGAVLDARAIYAKGVTMPINDIFAPISIIARRMSNEDRVNRKQLTLDTLTRELEPPMMEATLHAMELTDSPYMRRLGVDLQLHTPSEAYQPTLNKTKTIPNPNKTAVLNQTKAPDKTITIPAENVIDVNKTRMAEAAQPEPKYKMTVRGAPNKTRPVPKKQ